MTYEEMVDLIEADMAPEALQYRLGKDLVTKEDWANLPTRMRALHKWYKDASADGDEILSVKLRDEHYFMGEQTIHIDFDELFQLFNQKALDKSIISCYCL